MDVDIIELSDVSGRFILSDVSAAFVNGIRRIMMSEIPTMAIDGVNIYENTSTLFDEQIALRLGLIPLKTDLDLYTFRENCECEEGCGRCQVAFTLSLESPKEVSQNQKVASKMVYSGDLISNDENVVPVYPNIPIIKLITRKGKSGVSRQRIYLEAVARMGYGKDHIKWQAAVAGGYKNLPKISINNEECNRCGDCVEACPKGILKLSERLLTVVNEIDCSLCKLCEEACELKGIKVSTEQKSFVFDFESDMSFSAKEMVTMAADTLKEKAETLIELLEK